MTFVDYYKILEIDKTAKPADIKNAYRKLARKYHPDLNADNAGAKKNFQDVNEANEVLSDPEKRKKYDQYGNDWQNAQKFEEARKQQASDGNERRYGGAQSEGDFSDFFENLFSGSERGSRGQQVQFRGEDYNSILKLDIHAAYTTHQQTLTVNGKNIRITIPAGVDNDQTIKITGHGGAGANGGPNGDLYLKFSISNSTQFERKKNDLFTSVELNLYTAILGGNITIETLNGKVKLDVKPETQIGSKVKLKGKGFPVYKKEGTFGDLYVTYGVKIPTNLTDQQKTLFTELAAIGA